MKRNEADLIIEALDDRLKLVNEAIASIKVNTDTLPEVYERLAALEETVTTIEKAVTDTNRDLNQIENRVNVLEETV